MHGHPNRNWVETVFLATPKLPSVCLFKKEKIFPCFKRVIETRRETGNFVGTRDHGLGVFQHNSEFLPSFITYKNNFQFPLLINEQSF
jgi:hypothetical protein